MESNRQIQLLCNSNMNSKLEEWTNFIEVFNRLGENAIVGAGSLVINDVQKNTKVAGVPAKDLA